MGDLNLSRYQGISQFGSGYETALRNDTHARGSVDLVLAERMIRLCSETARYMYEIYTPTKLRCVSRSRPELESWLAVAAAGATTDEEIVDAICRFCSALEGSAPSELDDMLFGGTEEEIIERGSEWCTDVARVACVLSQVAGLPARIVSLFDLQRAHWGHEIIEVYRNCVWGSADPLTNVVYRHPDGRPATAWELMKSPALVEAHWRSEATPYTRTSQFTGVAVSNYLVWDRGRYDYAVSRVNDYYREVLELSARGWPDGLC